MRFKLLISLLLVLAICSCSSMYYGTMEKLGIHKRDIMVDRVKDARDSQSDAREQFLSAMDQFKGVVKYDGGDLAKQYNQLQATLDESEEKAQAVHDHIDSVEDVSEDLFDEWRDELKLYSSASLRQASQRKYNTTKAKYEQLIRAMRGAEAKLEPVLVPLRDQVLFMKHNLNARAIAGLSGELITVQANVDSLIRDMDIAIKQADQFIAQLQE